MEARTKLAIVNSHNNEKWYQQGQDRLINSLIHHGNPFFIFDSVCTKHADGGWTLENEFHIDKYNYPNNTPYTLKAAAMQAAKYAGFTHLFWLDCSVWAIRDPMPIFDFLDSDGYYFWPSGFTIWETCNDRTREYFGISEEEARRAPDCSTSMFGLNLGNPVAELALDMWLQAAKDGMFEGSRDEIPMHPNGRMFQHRQDQSAMSCIIYKLGLKMQTGFSSYANDKGEYGDDVTFVMRGL